jgi:putative two-component system response regulator
VTQKSIQPNENKADPEELVELTDESTAFEEATDADAGHATEILGCKSLFAHPGVANLILDKNLKIVSFTPKTAELFLKYYSLENKPFFSVFRNVAGIDDLRDLLLSLRNPRRGFSWIGTFTHKTPDTRTLLTRTSFIPFFTPKKVLAGYFVSFEDITEPIQELTHNTFKSILQAAKLKDNDTGLHDERVGYYCKKMAERLYAERLMPQIDPDFIENIVFLAAMHDVGKIGTPDYILQKPGKLDEKEWEIMREHTINGTFILASYPSPMAKEIALSHHEWWNGTGYPFKLEGEMIPLSARIATIADVYDALRMKRSYKPELTHAEAVQKIVAGRGTQFDPQLIDIFVKMNQDFDDIWNLMKDVDSAKGTDRDRASEVSQSL